ncbi:MAG TPA: PD-(D/E)XK nuclease family protein [Thermoanaerobaculia bacterium]|nr:PD-(D/E)XK nuclease family protein [Thermoanaerobaculia bacterium]
MTPERERSLPETGGPPPAALLWAASPRAAEAALMADLDALRPRALAALRESTAAVWVVVPSRVLRHHLLSRIAERFGAVTGVEVLTLRRIARRLFELAGEPVETNEGLFELLARRALAQEKEIANWLDELAGGYGPAVATLRDLLDAGFDGAHQEAALEAIGNCRAKSKLPRGRAVLRAAARLAESLTGLPPLRDPDLLRRAAELLARHEGVTPPCRCLLVHGFADASGAALELLGALARAVPVRAHLVVGPPESERFGRLLRERLGGLLGASAPPAAATLSELPLVAHLDPRAEVRETGWALLADLAAGIPPERIGVIARSLEPYARFVREEWPALGIPFSSPTASPFATATSRYLTGFRELLEQGGRTGIDRWLGLCGLGAGELLEPRLALHLLGAARLEQVARLDLARLVPADGLRLPLRGAAPADDEAPEAEENAAPLTSRRVPLKTLQELQQRATALVKRFASWPERASASVHARHLRDLLAQLAAGPERPGPAEIAKGITRAFADLPPKLVLDREEVALLLDRAIGDGPREPLGGAGGGVQLLDVTAARGLTFERLHLLGLSQGRFPRTISEDPLLPDELRRALAPLLPALGAKQDGRAEEVYLLHTLLGAAPEVRLHRPEYDEEARPQPVSPLLVPLLATGQVKPHEPPEPPALLPLPTATRNAGLARREGEFVRHLEALLGEVEGRSPAEARLLARAHLARLEEVEPRGDGARTSCRLGGSLLGGVGPIRPGNDPRQHPPAATLLEGLARCPWQFFLRRLLRLEPPADAAAGLPTLSPLLVGNVVHAFLEAEARRAGVPVHVPLADALRDSERPELSGLRRSVRALRGAAEKALRDEGLAAWPLADALAHRAELRLAPLRNSSRRARLVGAELDGESAIRLADGSERTVRFRVDRVEEHGDELLFIDFKAGSPAGLTGKRRETLANQLRKAIAEGRRLQVAIYTATECDAPVRGSYLFLDPNTSDTAWEVSLSGDDVEARRALIATLSVLFRAWDEGIFLPRLLDEKLEKASPYCESCEVMDACVQYDSLLRHGYRDRITHLRDDPSTGDESERLALALFDLGRNPEDEEKAG